MTRHIWTGAQEAWLRVNYIAKGGRACANHIGATLHAVHHRAREMGLARPKDSLRIASTDHIDSVIRSCHASGSTRPYQDAAERLGRSPDWIGARARQMGLRARTSPAPAMTEGEAKYIRAHLHWPARRISDALRARGSQQSMLSVRRYIRASGLSETVSDVMNSEQVALAMGVDSLSVQRWIFRGQLIAERRGPQDNTFVITEADLAGFILMNPETIHLGKIETAQTKSWFIDLICRHPKAPTWDESYRRRLILSLHSVRPEYDAERISTIMGIDRGYVVEIIGPTGKRRRAA